MSDTPPDTAYIPAQGITTELDSASLRHALSHFASGVIVVTAISDGSPTGLTCQSFSALSLDPPLVLLCPSRTSSSWPGIAAAGTFCVNVLTHEQQWICQQFAVSGGDKFRGVDWEAGLDGIPRIDGALATIDCRLYSVTDGGDHYVVIGQVVNVAVGSGLPLLYFRSSYHRLQP
jgi:3-hydroxy-9,10-secoandrosta-1,3,5(10)-triene-9,17-dione monooxygenase reductase component